MTDVPGQDAAYAKNISSSFNGVVGGYLNSPYAYHPWTISDWERFHTQPKFPYWVAGHNVEEEAKECVSQLHALKIPKGASVGVDMETRVNIRYLELFFDVVRPAGYKVLVYGSAAFVFQNPPLNGYVVADYDNKPEFLPEWNSRAVRGKQYTSGENVDLCIFRDWVVKDFWH